MRCARARSAAYLLEDDASAFVASRGLHLYRRLRPVIAKCRGVTPGSRATNEGGDYDRHGDGSESEGHLAHVERSYGESRQGSSDDHSGVSARRVGPDPLTQCAGFCLRTGGLHRDAVEGWRTGNTDTWTDLLRRPPRCSCRSPERELHQAGVISGAPDQEQGSSGARARRVTVR